RRGRRDVCRLSCGEPEDGQSGVRENAPLSYWRASRLRSGEKAGPSPYSLPVSTPRRRCSLRSSRANHDSSRPRNAHGLVPTQTFAIVERPMIAIHNGQLAVEAGTGTRTASWSWYFDHEIRNCWVALAGYSVAYTDDDHHVKTLSVDVSCAI